MGPETNGPSKGPLRTLHARHTPHHPRRRHRHRHLTHHCRALRACHCRRSLQHPHCRYHRGRHLHRLPRRRIHWPPRRHPQPRLLRLLHCHRPRPRRRCCAFSNGAVAAGQKCMTTKNLQAQQTRAPCPCTRRRQPRGGTCAVSTLEMAAGAPQRAPACPRPWKGSRPLGALRGLPVAGPSRWRCRGAANPSPWPAAPPPASCAAKRWRFGERTRCPRLPRGPANSRCYRRWRRGPFPRPSPRRRRR
mmetsp:Transcript_37153/g.63216  ORF Transcript_37153/g.63216 Transcript_37153/m.63216 type:complete len:247 (-) Transcript_37153:44-784(-)